jgi:hypothetical protein
MDIGQQVRVIQVEEVPQPARKVALPVDLADERLMEEPAKASSVADPDARATVDADHRGQ